MVLTTTGSKSGEPRDGRRELSRDGEDYVVVGSKSGKPDDPAWFTNLAHESGRDRRSRRTDIPGAAKVAEGADRDTLWDAHVAEYPRFAEYPSKTDRIIPIARLTPLG